MRASSVVKPQVSLVYLTPDAELKGVEAFAPDAANGGSVTWTGGGSWGFYSFSYGANSAAVRTLCIKKDTGANTGLVALDGIQVIQGNRGGQCVIFLVHDKDRHAKQRRHNPGPIIAADIEQHPAVRFEQMRAGAELL